MNASAVILKLVGYSDLNKVTPIRENGRARVLAIDQEDRSLGAIRRCCAIRYLEVVFAGDSSVRPALVEVGVDVEVAIPASSGRRAVVAGCCSGTPACASSGEERAIIDVLQALEVALWRHCKCCCCEQQA